MKRALKFIIRMLVTAGIVVGVVFLVSYFITPKADATKIMQAETDYNLAQKIEDSYSGFLRADNSVVKSPVEMMPDNPSASTGYNALTKTDMLPASKKVSDVFIVYYQYYVSTSSFLTVADNGFQSKILGQMKNLNQQVDETIKYLDHLDNYAKTKNYNTSNYANDSTFFQRFDKWVISYQKQTNILMNLADNLREYVCRTNYKTNVNEFRYVAEVKLEIVKDYADVIFVDVLNQKYKESDALHPLLQNTNTIDPTFENTYKKFMQKVENPVVPNFEKLFENNNTYNKYENSMFLDYGKIDKAKLYNKNFDQYSTEKENYLAGFYQLSPFYTNNKLQETNYFYNESSGLTDAEKNVKRTKFIDRYYDEMLASDSERETEYLQAQFQYLYLNNLYNYLLGESL